MFNITDTVETSIVTYITELKLYNLFILFTLISNHSSYCIKFKVSFLNLISNAKNYHVPT